MDELKSWWSLVTQLGPGAAFVLGICTVFLWRKLNSEQEYSRSRDASNLDVLNKITNMLENETGSNDAVIALIKEQRDAIIAHMDRMKNDLRKVR